MAIWSAVRLPRYSCTLMASTFIFLNVLEVSRTKAIQFQYFHCVSLSYSVHCVLRSVLEVITASNIPEAQRKAKTDINKSRFSVETTTLVPPFFPEPFTLDCPPPRTPTTLGLGVVEIKYKSLPLFSFSFSGNNSEEFF